MDGFVKGVIGVTLALLAFVFVNAYIGSRTGRDLGGLDDRIETMAVAGRALQPHPVLELPGDSEVGAFTIAAFGMGMVVGYTWRKLFAREGDQLVSSPTGAPAHRPAGQPVSSPGEHDQLPSSPVDQLAG